MNKSTLKVGNVYFDCSWLSISVPVPDITCWIYDGSESDPERGLIHKFVDPEWYYLKNILAELNETQVNTYTMPEGPSLMIIKEDEIEDMLYDLDELKAFVETLGTETNAERIYGA